MARKLSYDEVKDLFDYDPKTGNLTWAVDRQKIQKGDLAGALTRDGFVVVTVNGEKVRGQYLAWLLYFKQWPEGRIKMLSTIDADLTTDAGKMARQDLRIDNLELAANHLSQHPATVRQREYAASRRKVHEAYLRNRTADFPSMFNNVRFDRSAGHFVVSELASLKEENSPSFELRSMREVARFSTLEAAEVVAGGMHANRAALKDDITGGDILPPVLPAAIADIPAGALGPTLGDIHTRLAYDTSRGAIFWRAAPRQYQDATRATTTGRTSYVQVDNWRLPAHSLAFFMYYGTWPTRGTIAPFDGNWRNIALANLMFDHDRVIEHPLDKLRREG